nr:hypothetical protein [uncultured Draconibacterium sp.]
MLSLLVYGRIVTNPTEGLNSMVFVVQHENKKVSESSEVIKERKTVKCEVPLKMLSALERELIQVNQKVMITGKPHFYYYNTEKSEKQYCQYCKVDTIEFEN